MIRLICVLTTLFALTPSWAQSIGQAKITGLVIDSLSQSPLSHTNIYLENTTLGSSSKRNGYFLINKIKAGNYTLIAERIGYSPFRKNIVLTDSLDFFIQLSPSIIKGEQILVTANRREQTAQMTPASVEIISQKELRRQPIVTFDQALERIPGISVYRSSGVSVQSLSIRGSSDIAGGGVGNRVLLLIDGRPALTSDTGGALWSLVPTNIIDHVEIVKGAFSSLYGSTAMGGVVNVITKNPAYRRSGNVSLGYGIFEAPITDIRYTKSLTTFKQLQMSYSGIVNQLSYTFNAGYKTSDGHSQNAGYEVYNIFSKLIYDFKENRYFEFSAGNSGAKNDYPHTWLGNLHPLEVKAVDRDDRQQKDDLNLDFKYWAIPAENYNYSTRFYFYRNTSLSTFNENDKQWRVNGNKPLGLHTDVVADKFGHITQLDIELNDTNHMITGLDIQLDQVKSSPDSIMYGDRQVNNYAFYMQNELRINSKLVSTLGLRYDINHLNGGITQSQLSSNLALLYNFTDRVSTRILAGQAFRAPSIAERFFQEELNGGTLFKPNPDLKAERMDISFESGVTYKPHDKIYLDVAYFFYRYKDMIYWQQISAEEGVVYELFQVRNLNEAIIQGLEASVNLKPFHNFAIKGSYVYLDAQDRSKERTDDFLPYKVKHTFTFSVSELYNNFTFYFDGRYRSKVNEVFLYPLEAPEAYTLFKAKIGYRINDNYSLSLAVNNLLNVQYEELARYRMPGRNYLLETFYSF